MRHALCVWLSCLLAVPTLLLAQPAPTDADVQKGISLVDDGDYDAAILTLDNAARRLAQDKSRAKDLSQAYLYLGIAYLGKGHEAAAKANFREAIEQIKDLTLSPEKFPPKVIDAFEAARAEVAAAPPAAATAAPAPPAGGQPPKEQKKGGGGKALWILGGVAVAGGAVALAAGGGGGSGSAAPTTTTLPRDTRTVNTFGPLTLTEAAYGQTFTIVVAGTGVLEATVTWSSTGGLRPAVLAIDLFDAAASKVATSNRTNDTTSVLTANVQPLTGAPSQEYQLQVYHRDSCDGCVATFNLTVKHP